MNTSTICLLIISILQAPEAPKVRRLSVISHYSSELVFHYARPVFVVDEGVKDGAIECFKSSLKSTGLFTDVQVTLKPTEDGQWVDIDITPTWDNRRKYFVIDEIRFDGFESFDLERLKDELKQEGVRPGISFWRFSLNEIGNMLDDAASRIYDSDDLMLERLAEVDMPHPRFGVQVIDSLNVRLTISLNRNHPCDR